MFLGCCYGHEERPRDVDVVLEHVFKGAKEMEVEENGGILHNWKMKVLWLA